MKNKSKNAIITGGSSGIGKATAKLLASKGYNISIIGRNQEKLNIAKTEIEEVIVNNNSQILTISADVSKQLEISQAINLAVEKLGDPDILITSAGIAYPGYFQDLPIEIFEETMAINYFGSLYSIKAVLPFMMARKQGHIVLISSGAGLIGIYGYSPYSPTKFALRGLAESLRSELKPQGISVSIIYPPDTDTPQFQEENKTKPKVTKLITSTAKIWTPDAIAQCIFEGLEKKKFAITPGFSIAILNRFYSLISPGLNWYFDKIIANN